MSATPRLTYTLRRIFYSAFKIFIYIRVYLIHKLEYKIEADHCQAIKDNKKSPYPTDHSAKQGPLYASSGARTLDTLIKSQVLYQLS